MACNPAFARSLVGLTALLTAIAGCTSTGSNPGALDDAAMTPDGQSDVSLDDSRPNACIDASIKLIQASDYDQSCTVDSDCRYIAEGNACTPCAFDCSFAAAINVSALAQYNSDVANTPAVSPEFNGRDCVSGCPSCSVHVAWAASVKHRQQANAPRRPLMQEMTPRTRAPTPPIARPMPVVMRTPALTLRTQRVLRRATAAAAYASQLPNRARATASRLTAPTARSCAATRVMRPGSRATASTVPPTAASMSAIASRCRRALQTLLAHATRGNPRAYRAEQSRAPRSAAVKRPARSRAMRVRNGSASEPSKRAEGRSGGSRRGRR